MLITVMMILTILSVASVFVYKAQKHEQNDKFSQNAAEKITFLINTIQQYQAEMDHEDSTYTMSVDNEFPETMDQLKTVPTFHNCSIQSDHCRLLLESPFGGRMFLKNNNMHDKKIDLYMQIENYANLHKDLEKNGNLEPLVSVHNLKHFTYSSNYLWSILQSVIGLIPRSSIKEVNGKWYFVVDIYAAAGMTNNDAEKAGVTRNDGTVPLLENWDTGGNYKLIVKEHGIKLSDGETLSSSTVAIASGTAKVNTNDDLSNLVKINTSHCEKVVNDGFFSINERDLNIAAFIKGIYPSKSSNIVNYDIGTFGVTYSLKNGILTFNLVNFAFGNHGIRGQFGDVNSSTMNNEYPISGEVSYIVTCKRAKSTNS